MWEWGVLILLLAWAITLTVLYDQEKRNSCDPARQKSSGDPSENSSENPNLAESRPSSKILHPLHQASLEEQLAYWKLHTPDWSAVTKEHYKWVAIIEFNQGQATCVNDTNPDIHKDCLRWFMVYITPLAADHPEWTGRIFLHSPDGPLLVKECEFPVISWNIRLALWGTGQLLGVDPYFMNDSNHDGFPKDDMQQFADKQDHLVFRGNTTNEKRRWVIEKYQTTSDMDFKFSAKGIEQKKLQEERPELFGDFMDVKDQRSYKYLLNIDGYGAAWNRTEWQLRSHCVMFLDTQYYMFTSKHLKPWVHYVPFSATDVDKEDDLPKHFQFIKTLQNNQVSSLIQQANTYARTLNSTSQALLYTEHLITQALALYAQNLPQ